MPNLKRIIGLNVTGPFWKTGWILQVRVREECERKCKAGDVCGWKLMSAWSRGRLELASEHL